MIRFLIAASILCTACDAPDETPAETPAEIPEVPQAVSEPECAPLQVTVDGTSAEFPHGLAVESDEGLVVHLFSMEGITCENVLAGFWASPPGMAHVSIRQHEGRGYASTDNRTTGAEVRSMGDAGAAGSDVSLCLDEEASFRRGVGKPPVVMSGHFEGTFCGRAE
ncbi:MAG: hypothetical protein AB8H86_21545 [Polyangiales bacterium]